MQLIPRNNLYNKINKFQKGGPAYFKSYGINSDKFKSMFNALRTRGLSNQVAFEITWQSMKEVPKGYYSFGSRFNNVNSWADNVVNHQLNRNIYKNARNATNFQEYRNATLPYNRQRGYTEWLLNGRDQGKDFINQYIKDNNLGEPVVMNDQDNDFGILTAQKGVKLSPRQSGILSRSATGKVYGNYSKAVDGNQLLPDWAISGIDRINDDLGTDIPTGASNCTLTASQWVNPRVPISKAQTILDNPNRYGFVEIPEAHVLPGDLVIATNPQLGNHHTMLVSGFAQSSHKHTLNGKSYDVNAGDILTRYSNGSTVGGYRQGVPLNAYIDQSHGKTQTDYYRFSPVGMDPQVLLPEIVVTPNGSYVPKGQKTIRIK